MPLEWKPQSIEVYLNWIDVLLNEASDELTPWELNFISNIEEHLLNKWTLTEAQANKLESIYANNTK